MAKDYLELDFYDLQLRFSMDRRQFLKLTAGGIMVFFAVDLAAGQLATNSARSKLLFVLRVQAGNRRS